MSEQFLATASVRIVPDVTGFAATLEAELLAATGATKTLTAATRQTAVAQTEAGAAAAREAVAQRTAAVAARQSAVAHSQLARGATTATASQFGLRGAVLASSGPFLAAVIAVTAITKSIHESSKEAEAGARVNAILGTSLGRLSEEWAHQQAAIGLSTTAALTYQGAIAQVFRNVNIASAENAKFSQNLVTRAADVAARANKPVTEVLRAFQLALSGNLRGLRQFVPAVDAATIANRALADTGKQTKDSLTTQELVLARYEVIMAKSANQAGTLRERQHGLAVEGKILESNIANLAATIGGPLATALGRAIEGVNALFGGFHKLNEIAGHINIPFLDDDNFSRLLLFKQQEDAVNESLNIIQQTISGLSLAGPFDVATNSALAFLNVLTQITNHLRAGLGQSLAGVNEAVLRTQISGGSLQDVLQGQQAAVAVAQGAAASSILAAIGAKPGTKAGDAAIQARRDAEQTLKDNQDAVAATQAEIAAAAKKGATAAKKAAKSRQEILDEQDQALLDAQQFAQGQLDLKAAGAKSLQQQINIDKARIVLDAQQITQAQKQIHDEQLKKTTIQALRIAEAGTRTEIKKLEEERAQAARDQAKLVEDRKKQRLDLDIQIAEANKNIAAERKALQARIAFDRIQLQNVHGDLVRKKQLQLEIAQDTQTLKDLKKSKQDNMSATQAFLFLQAQQGFASTVLSNLLTTAGTAGGTSGAISTPTAIGNPLPPPGTGFPKRPSADLSAAAQIAGGPTGASSGQMATLIHVQREMLVVLLRLVGQRTHPEATHQRTWSATEMLNTGW